MFFIFGYKFFVSLFFFFHFCSFLFFRFQFFFFSFFIFRFSFFVFCFFFFRSTFFFRYRRSAPGELRTPALVYILTNATFEYQACHLVRYILLVKLISKNVTGRLSSSRKTIFFCKCYKNLSKKPFHRSPY